MVVKFGLAASEETRRVAILLGSEQSAGDVASLAK
jgi:hypothetical protein